MVEIMDDGIQVWESSHGSINDGVRRLWRRNRNAAYRQAYKELNGKSHPASRSGEPKKDLEVLLKKTEPPHGMTWGDFGVLWDLHPEHPYTPVLRKRPVSDEWEALQKSRTPVEE
jgi:hypothetical protein